MGQCLCKKKIDRQRATITAIANLQSIVETKSLKDSAKYIKDCIRMDPTGTFCNLPAIKKDTLVHVMLRNTDLFPLPLFLDVANLPDTRFDLPGNSGETTLGLACKIEDSTFMNVVIDTDIDLRMALTPIGVADMPEDLEKLEIGSFSSCLDYAIENGFVEHVKTLMSSEITWPLSYLRNALMSLTKDGDKKAEILEILLSESDEALIHDAQAANLLLWGIQNDEKELVAILLDFVGLNLNCRDPAGRTPLHYACASGDIVTIELLLKNGAALTQLDKRGDSPLHCVIRTADDVSIRESLLPRLLLSTAGKSLISHRNNSGDDCMDILEEMRPHLKPKQFQKLLSSLQNAVSTLKQEDKIEPTTYEQALHEADAPNIRPALFLMSPEVAEKIRGDRKDTFKKYVDWDEGDKALGEAIGTTAQPSILNAPEKEAIDVASLIDPELLGDDLLGKYILDKNPDTTAKVSCGRFVLDGQELKLYYKDGNLEAKILTDGQEVFGTITQTVGRNVALTLKNEFWTGTVTELSAENDCIMIEWEDGAVWRKLPESEIEDIVEEAICEEKVPDQVDIHDENINTAIAVPDQVDLEDESTHTAIAVPDQVHIEQIKINTGTTTSVDISDDTETVDLKLFPGKVDGKDEAVVQDTANSFSEPRSLKVKNIQTVASDSNSETAKSSESSSLSLNTEELDKFSSGYSSDSAADSQE